ncbi:Sodium/hydrogen exchanger family-domain-containing protein [Lactarius indigo]|nr:Sodium/hydrogen exchanger family-domain-containing protein [Lactarius indigo]
MPWEFLDSSPASVAYTLLGGFVVATRLIVLKYNLVSLVIKEKLYMNEVVFGTGFGVLLGPHVLDIFDPRSWTSITDTLTREIMRVVLVTGLFAIGVQLPKKYMAKNVRSLLIMVVPTMAFGWFIPIISSAVIGGKFADKYVPTHIRDLLIAESAANDGLAYPFLSISIFLTVEASRATAFGKWIVIGCLYQVVLGTVFGAVIGLLFSRILRFSQEKGFLDRESYIAQFISLALFTAGATNSLGNDDLLVAFAAGLLIIHDDAGSSLIHVYREQTEHDSFSAVLDLVLNCACFIYIGAWLPFDKFRISEIGVTPWRLVVLVLIILALRRIPSLLLLYKLIPEVANWREALFCGHFGPMGVSAIFVSTLAQSRLKTPHDPPQTQEDHLAIALQPIVAFVVLGSILTHGLSIPFFSASHRTLTITRSIAAQPDWLLRVRRVPPHVDVERRATLEGADDTIAIRKESHRDEEKEVEWKAEPARSSRTST